MDAAAIFTCARRGGVGLLAGCGAPLSDRSTQVLCPARAVESAAPTKRFMEHEECRQCGRPHTGIGRPESGPGLAIQWSVPTLHPWGSVHHLAWLRYLPRLNGDAWCVPLSPASELPDM